MLPTPDNHGHPRQRDMARRPPPSQVSPVQHLPTPLIRDSRGCPSQRDLYSMLTGCHRPMLPTPDNHGHPRQRDPDSNPLPCQVLTGRHHPMLPTSDSHGHPRQRGLETFPPKCKVSNRCHRPMLLILDNHGHLSHLTLASLCTQPPVQTGSPHHQGAISDNHGQHPRPGQANISSISLRTPNNKSHQRQRNSSNS